MPDVTVIPDGALGKHGSIRTSAPETGSGHLTRRANGAVGLPGRWRNAARGPEPAGPSGLGRIFPECGVALLDRRMTAALRSAPCLEKNADSNAGVRMEVWSPRRQACGVPNRRRPGTAHNAHSPREPHDGHTASTGEVTPSDGIPTAATHPTPTEAYPMVLSTERQSDTKPEAGKADKARQIEKTRESSDPTRQADSTPEWLKAMSRSTEQMWSMWQLRSEKKESSPTEAAKDLDGTFQDAMTLTRTLIQDSFALQKKWLDDCCALTANAKNASPEVKKTAERCNETLSGMIEMQEGFWQQWLGGVRDVEQQMMPKVMEAAEQIEHAEARADKTPEDDHTDHGKNVDKDMKSETRNRTDTDTETATKSRTRAETDTDSGTQTKSANAPKPTTDESKKGRKNS